MTKKIRSDRLGPIAELLSDQALARFSTLQAKVESLDQRLAELSSQAIHQRGEVRTLQDARIVSTFEQWTAQESEALNQQLKELRQELEAARADAQCAFGKHQVLKRLA